MFPAIKANAKRATKTCKLFYIIAAFLFGGAGGGGSTQQSFKRGGSTPRSNALPFYMPFLTEKVSLLKNSI